MATPDTTSDTRTNWSRPHLAEALQDAVAAMGIDLHSATPDVMAPLDQFHGGGKTATRELARRVEGLAGSRVLDVGGGLGGPARMLASEFGARVTVFDLTLDYLKAGELLTERMGLHGQVDFQHGNALDLPFPDGSFDVVWTQNSGMNIADKLRLYQGFFRVLKSGGRLAQLEPVAGPVQPPHFPLMWASDPSGSHLLTAEDFRQTLLDHGFVERYWNPSVKFPETSSSSSTTTLTIQQLVMGERLPAIQASRKRNAAEDRLRSVIAVFEHP